MKYITRTILILSCLSLLTDAASEMLYPIIPIYLKSIGFSIVVIGVLEGIAEATAGLSKGYFGKMSDVSGRRVIFVQLGYALSSISKPMMGMFIFPIWIFFSRTLDRFGKGIRTSARDAMLSDESLPNTKGKIFGFHRAMDTLGAVIGPLLALVYLKIYPKDYKTLFFIAFIPGLLTVATSLLLKENKIEKNRSIKNVPFFSFLKYWEKSPTDYKKLIIGLLCFTIFNSSDIFLLLKAKQEGLNDTTLLSLYIFYNLVYAIFSFPVGIIADIIGFKKILIIGLTLFSIVYVGMSVNSNLYMFYFLFFLYGIFASATEGISKAWISNITEKTETATAIGTYSGLQSICTMIASSLTGFIWFNYDSKIALVVPGIASIFIIFYFIYLPKPTFIDEKN